MCVQDSRRKNLKRTLDRVTVNSGLFKSRQANSGQVSYRGQVSSGLINRGDAERRQVNSGRLNG